MDKIVHGPWKKTHGVAERIRFSQEITKEELLTLREHALDHDAESCYQMGMLMLYGNDLVRNEREAHTWFTLGSINGNHPSTFMLAEMYRLGIGVEIDLNKACSYYQDSAELGSVKAQYELARLLHTMGDNAGDSETLFKAKIWMHYAAENGHREAMCFIGETLLSDPEANEADRKKGAEYLIKAHEMGLTQALQIMQKHNVALGREIQPDPTGRTV